MALDSAKKDIFGIAKSDNVKFIQLQFTDILGTLKSVAIPIERLEDVLDKGIWFDGSSIEGFARISESDMVLQPDISTYRVIPWKPQDKKVARFICDVYTPDGVPFPGDPRGILKKAVEEAKKEGYIFNTGPEIEFFLLKKDGEKITTVPHDVGGYFDYSPLDLASDVRKDIIFALEDLGMTVEMSHHEVGPGQHEIDVKYSDALSSADNTITLKYTIKAIAQRFGLHATCMPKPIYGVNGSGMHVHQSLFDLKGNNLFYEANDKYKLSKTAYSFIAGQLSHARSMSAVLAPTVNSYKRLVPGYEAPVYICWAQINRSALIRIPRYSPGRELATRAELRCPDPSCNPYLAFAVMLKAGLDGVKNIMSPPAPTEEDVYEFDTSKLEQKNIKTLPASLQEALAEMSNNAVVKDALGNHTYKRFIDAKTAEWNDYRIKVTPWEIERYLEVL
jgi:glutamine synthetase